MEEWKKSKEISNATRDGILAHDYTRGRNVAEGQEGAESYEQRFWLEANTFSNIRQIRKFRATNVGCLDSYAMATTSFLRYKRTL